MAVKFPDLHSSEGLQFLDQYLLSRSYISGHSATENDLIVARALSGKQTKDYINITRWLKHITYLEKDSACFPKSQETLTLAGMENRSSNEVLQTE